MCVRACVHLHVHACVCALPREATHGDQWRMRTEWVLVLRRSLSLGASAQFEFVCMCAACLRAVLCLACKAIAHEATANIAMTYAVMAHVIMAHIVMAYIIIPVWIRGTRLWPTEDCIVPCNHAMQCIHPCIFALVCCCCCCCCCCCQCRCTRLPPTPHPPPRPSPQCRRCQRCAWACVQTFVSTCV